MIRAIHIEDEPRNIELLQNLVKSCCEGIIEFTGTATNVADGYDLIKDTKPQLVFLDIELNNGNAFELLEKVQSLIGIDFEIIFITAFNEYAVKAFRQNAIDYLLKPISTQELEQAIERVREKIAGTSSNQDILNALHQLRTNHSHLKIALPVADGVQFIKTEDIMRIEAKGGYVIVYMVNNQKITSVKSIGDFENQLPHPQFIRVHNSWIVNNNFLKKYFRGKNSFLQMDDDSIVPVSLRKKGDLLDTLGC